MIFIISQFFCGEVSSIRHNRQRTQVAKNWFCILGDQTEKLSLLWENKYCKIYLNVVCLKQIKKIRFKNLTYGV